MESIVALKTAAEQKSQPLYDQETEAPLSLETDLGYSAGIPLFLQRSAQPLSFQNQPTVQPKLVVGEPNDPYEAEADRVAMIVQSGSTTSLPSSSIEAPNSSIQRKCAQCEASQHPDEEKETLVQAKSSIGASPISPTLSSSNLHLPDSGAPLPERVRTKVEPFLGADLSHVKVHTSPAAQQTAAALNAKAFTHKHHIWLGPNQSPDDSALMAHEATHVVQQTSDQPAHSDSLAISASPPQIQRQHIDSSTPSPQIDPNPSSRPSTRTTATALPNDEHLLSILNAVPEFNVIPVIETLGGVRNVEQTHPNSFELIRQRIVQRYGRSVFNWMYANDTQIMHLVRNANELQSHTRELLDRYQAAGQTVAYETVWQIAQSYDFSYLKAVQGYEQAGDVALLLWEGFLGGEVHRIALNIQDTAADAQFSAEERARLSEERIRIGRGAIGMSVATKEILFWWDDNITLQSLLAPEDGAEQEGEALAWARLSGQATAILRRQGRYYVYGLNYQYRYSDIWEQSTFEEHRTNIIPTLGSLALAVTTTDGYVIRPNSGQRFFGGDQSQRPETYLTADAQLLERHGSELSNEQALQLFQQMTLDVIVTNLTDAERRLQTALNRLYPDGLLSPTAGANLQHNTATLRRALLIAANLATRISDSEPTLAQLDETEEVLATIGRIAEEDPTATVLVVNQHDPDDSAPLQPDEVEDRLAGQRSGDAAMTAVGEIRQRLENIVTIRRYVYAHPDQALAFPQVYEQLLPRFSQGQQLYFRGVLLLRDLAQIAATLGITVVDLTLLVAGLFSGGVSALAIAGLSTGIGAVQVGLQFAEAQRLTAMSALDFPGGFQLATSEQATSAHRWAWIGLGLTVLSAGSFIHGANQLARLRAVLNSSDLTAIVAHSELSLNRIASELGTTEQALVRELETLRGPARVELLNRIRVVTARTILGAAQAPTVRWRPNPNGQVRTISEAVEIARRNGVNIPEDIRFAAVEARDLPSNASAAYAQFGQKHLDDLIEWEDFYNRYEQIPVRISRELLASDEAIVAIMGHEMHELNALRRLFEESGGVMRAGRLRSLIRPGIPNNLHDQAWDVADVLVRRMQQTPTTP